ncbi:MAG: putative lipid II flippase FtsW [Nitrospirota bacterium]
MQSRARVDVFLFLITIALIGLGVLMIYSASAITAKEYTGDSYYFLKRQFCWIILGLIGLFGAWRLNYHSLQNKSFSLFVAGLFLLSLTLVPGLGQELNGATRWIKIGFLSFQPSELLKVVFVIYLTNFIVCKKKDMEDFFKGFVPALSFLLIVSIILLKQPHFGMVILLCMVTVSILFVGGARIRHLIYLVLAAIPTICILVLIAPYRLKRWFAFLDPWADPKHTGYQIIQSLIALGSGGLWGAGLGESKLKLFYLPQSSTDFIFAVIGEEGGFLLAVLVIFLFFGFAFAGCKISLSARDPYGSLLAFGITMLIIVQSLLNIGVVTAVVPSTGMPLPFVSFGGSALLLNMIGVGIILNIAKQSQNQPYNCRLYQ